MLKFKNTPAIIHIIVIANQTQQKYTCVLQFIVWNSTTVLLKFKYLLKLWIEYIVKDNQKRITLHVY